MGTDISWEVVQELIGKVALINANSGIPQSVFVTEECSELIKEFCKDRRGEGEAGYIFAEAFDVFTTLLILFHQNGISVQTILNNVHYKLTRALERYERNEEI